MAGIKKGGEREAEIPPDLKSLGIPRVPRDEVTPLHVLVEAMRAKWEQADLDGAAALAKAAAPYVHARVPAERPPEDLSGVSDAELDRLASRFRAGHAVEDPGEPA